MIKRMNELCICAIEQGYSLTMEGRIYIDLIIYMKLNNIYKEDKEDGR